MNLRPGEIDRLKQQFPEKTFVFVSQAARSTLPPLDKSKYIVPRSSTISQFLFILRSRMKLPPEKALYLFVKNTLPPSSMTFRDIEHLYADDDGAVRITYAAESTFGYRGA
jgi:GABA(A) receptor-associated protein